MRRVQVAVIWLSLAGAATYLFLFDPAKGIGYPSCPFRMLTGWQCPGCGTTRALHQLLHGHPVNAFELNPLLIVALPLLAFALFTYTRSAISNKNIASGIFPAKYSWVIFGVIITFWIFRNTPMYPFAS
jgi:hypothetical protein